ncbi:hypothetical protein EBX93_00415 [bacterium]|nr:hypothetical protein [bacterium]
MKNNNGDEMDQILRYAMNIHESAEVAEIKQRLLDEPGAQAHLEVMRKSLELLNEDNASDPPPFNLAKKTILRVQGLKTQSIKYTPGKHINHQAGNYQNSIRRFDLLLAASLLILTCGVLAPWLHQAKTKAEKLACANNMREFHHSFQHYSAMQPDGKLPFVEPSGPRSFAGVYVPTLRQHGLLGDYHSVACPTNARKIPTETNLEQLESMYKNKSNPGYQRLVKEAGGDYAYNLGYNIKGSLVGLNNKSPGETPVLADKVNPNNTKLTFNHGGSGNNVLFIGGHVRWLPARKQNSLGDDIFLNEDHKILAGKHFQDHVLAPSHSMPFGTQNSQD